MTEKSVLHIFSLRPAGGRRVNCHPPRVGSRTRHVKPRTLQQRVVAAAGAGGELNGCERGAPRALCPLPVGLYPVKPSTCAHTHRAECVVCLRINDNVWRARCVACVTSNKLVCVCDIVSLVRRGDRFLSAAPGGSQPISIRDREIHEIPAR